MKTIIPLFFLLCLFSCDKAKVVPVSTYNCELTSAATTTQHPRSAAFQALLDASLAFNPGVQVSVTGQDGSSWSGAAGYADIANNVKLQPCHRTLVASISKVVTAAIIQQLQDEGRLTIEDKLADHLPAALIAEVANSDVVTLDQLLSHTSGIPDYLNGQQYFNTLNTPFLIETQREKLAYVYGEEAYSEPGRAYNYSNTNFLLLGLVIEELTGRKLWEVVQRRIVEPLGLKNFSMGTEENPLPDDAARPYLALLGGQYIDATEYAVSDAATGDGGIVSNMQDINLFIQALFSGELISEAAIERMTGSIQLTGERQADFDQWPDEGYGLGISRYNTPYGLAWGHTGGTATYSNVLLYFPESGVTFSKNTTSIDYSDPGPGFEGNDKLFEDLLELLFE